jgi:phosphatidylglycerophosphate synthase
MIRNKLRFMFFVNILTMLRIPLTLLFVYVTNLLIVHQAAFAGKISLLISAIIIFTDLFDGILARKYLVVTRFGQISDVACDFFYIILSMFLFNYYELISIYITSVMIYKFVEFIIFSVLYVDRIQKKDILFLFDKPGRIVSALYYLLPSIQVLYILKYINKYFVMEIIYLLILVLSLISSIIKLKIIRLSNA